MAYDVYIGKMVMPITPSKISMQIKNQNETINLINDGEVNLLKSPGLTEVSFTVLLPNQKYPFSNGNFIAPVNYLDYFEKLKKSVTPFSFIISRKTPDNKAMFNTNMKVGLEEYTIKESRENGLDLEVDIKLKQYKDYGTKRTMIEAPTDTAPILVSEERPTTTNPPATSGGGSGGSSGKYYKVQIDGMSEVKVYATSVQGAVTKACGSNYSGYVTVDGVRHYVNKGKIDDAYMKTSNTVKTAAKAAATGVGVSVVSTAKSAVASIASLVTKAVAKVAKPVTKITKPAVAGKRVASTKKNKVVAKLK